MTEHSRFRNIERARAEDPEGPGETADRARIAAVAGAAPASHVGGFARAGTELSADVAIEIAPTMATLGTGAVVRQEGGGQEIEDVAELATIDVATVEGQPFVRCARCDSDNTIHASHCTDCGATLATEAQRVFNERLWNEQRASAEKQREALAAMAERRMEERRTTVRSLPEPGILPPPELMRALESDDGPYLIEVLRALQKTRWLMAMAAAAVVLPFFLITLGGPALSWIGRVLLLLLVLAMLPRRFFSKLRDAWFSLIGRG